MDTWQAAEYIEALPKLRAEELLEMVTAFALGSGTLEKHDSRSIMRDWQQRAGQLEAQRQPQPHADRVANLAAMGIAVEIVGG
jgi:hypothetical protein